MDAFALDAFALDAFALDAFALDAFALDAKEPPRNEASSHEKEPIRGDAQIGSL